MKRWRELTRSVWIRPVRSQSGEPKVTDIIPAEGVSEEELLQMAFALEKKSEHPLAKAILSYAKEQKVPDGIEVSEFQAVPGNGLSGLNDGENLTGGNLNFIRQHAEVSEKCGGRGEKNWQIRERPRYSLPETEDFWG